MASKVNTKFVVFLVLALGAAGVLVGGLYYLNIRHNAERNIRRGDQAYQKGDMQMARELYARAINKEPGNLQFLQKLEDATAQIRPQTQEEANDLYRGWLAIIAHGARHDSTNAQRHVRLLEELVSVTRRTNAGWDGIAEPARDMWDRLPESDPLRPLAKVYQAMSVFRRTHVTTEEECVNAESELLEAVQALKTNDLAWATLIHSRMMMLDKMTREWRRTGAVVAEQNAKIDQSIEEALAAAPNGPEVARMNLFRMVMKYREDRASVTEEQIKAAADHLMANIVDVDDGALISDSTALLALVPGDGAQRSIDVAVQFLEKHPDAIDMQLGLVQMYSTVNDSANAEARAQLVMDSDPLPVGFLARIQPELRKRAAGIIVDIKALAWNNAPEADKPALAKATDEARNRLAALVTDKINDPYLLRADARLAYNRGEYERAARLYDQLVRETRFADDAEMLYFAAVSMHRIQQFGRAHERVEEALKIRPGATQLIVFKARLELIMGRKADAAATLGNLPASEGNSEEVQALVRAINSTGASAPGGAGEAGDESPAAAAIRTASGFMVKGDTEGARAALVSALEQEPENQDLLKRLMMVEIRAGQREKAIEYAERAQKLPGAESDMELVRLQAILKYEDPIEAMHAFHEQAIPDEVERALSMLENLRVLAAEQQELARRLERMTGSDEAGTAATIEAANKARALAQRAKEEFKTWLARAEQLTPNNPRLVNHHLDQAIEAKAWGKGGEVERIVERAKAIDSDQAGGMYCQGRAEIAHALDLLQQGKKAEARVRFQDAVGSLETTTNRIGFNARAWATLAFAYQQLGNHAQTQRAFEQAYKCNPTDLEVVRPYLSHLSQRGDQVRTLAVLREARQLWPNDAQFRNHFLTLEAESGGANGQAVALNSRRAIYRDYPGDLVNAAELVHLLSVAQPTRATIVDADGNPMISEGRWDRMSPEEREQITKQTRAQWDEQITEIVNALARISGGDSLEVVQLQAELMRERGDVKKGEDLLRQFIADQSEKTTSDALLGLAQYQVACSHFKEAIDTLTKAIPLQDPELREVDQRLGMLYMQLRMHENALKHLDAVLATNPGRSTRQQAVECLIKMAQPGSESNAEQSAAAEKRLEEAETRLREAMRESGEDLIWILLQANLMEARGDVLVAKGDSVGAERAYADLRDTLNRAQAMDPNSPTPRMLLAQYLMRDFKRSGRTSALGDALNALDEVDKIRKDLPEVGLLRVAILKMRGDKAAAIGELRRFVDRNPDNHSARADLAQLLVDNGEIDAAFTVIEVAIRRNPTLSIWYDAQGDLYKLARFDAKSALESYTKAYELTPSATALLKLADATLAGKTPDCKGLINRIAARTEDMAANPVLREMYARALKCADRMSEAVEQMKLAYEARQSMIDKNEMPAGNITQWFHSLSLLYAMPDKPGLVDVSAAEQVANDVCGSTMDAHELRAMAKVFMAAGDATLSRTIDFQRRAIAACPPDDKSLLAAMTGELAAQLYTVGRMQDAVDTYEALLAIEPDNVEAINNCAYLIAEALKDPARAIPMVERVIRLAGNDPAVLDTAGWTYHLAGDQEKALQTLQTSYQTRKTMVACLHLIEVHLKRGTSTDLLDAQRYVDEGNGMNPDVESKKKLQDFAAEISAKRSGGR